MLGGGGAKVCRSAQLRGVTAQGRGRLSGVRQLLVEFLPALVELGQGGSARKPSSQELRGRDGRAWNKVAEPGHNAAEPPLISASQSKVFTETLRWL